MVDVRFFVTQWASYLLMLLFLGGIIVIFLYVTRIMSTLKFKVPRINLAVFLIPAVLCLFYNPIQKSTKIFNLSIFFNIDSLFYVIIVLSYLLVRLVAVVRISKKFRGSLKSKING